MSSENSTYDDMALEAEMQNSQPSLHDFEVVSLRKLTWCQLDNELIYGLVRQGAKCKYCGLIIHRRCVPQVSASFCQARATTPESSLASFKSVAAGKSNDASLDSGDLKPIANSNSDSIDSNIRSTLRAINPGLSIKHRLSAIIREGWLSYRIDGKKMLHFWRLSAKDIAIYELPTSKLPLLKIPMESIVAVEQNKQAAYSAAQQRQSPLQQTNSEYPDVFTIRSPRLVIHAGEDPSKFETTADFNELSKGIGRAYGLGWMNTIRQLCFALPVATSEEVDIRAFYDVDPENPSCVLGSGQFGIVYAGRSKSNTSLEVAIKVIDKKHLESLDRLSLNQFIASEIRIMKEIKHPGITRLIDVLNNAEKIYVVMEKADTDMLDFILGHHNSRLSERSAKFIAKQILVALKYLHTAHKMAHCDLKPENVLLIMDANSKEFPLVKLADFGYSRIIGDHSFRASVVGTPAYLPPEVMSTSRPIFNKELDSWSVGVVIFVSLSGTFPYDSDDVGAVLQLQKTPISFPDDPWKKLTVESVEVIKALMEPNLRSRSSPAKALKHSWFTADYQAWCDLRALDARLAKNDSSNLEWTTTEEEKLWEAYRSANGLPNWAAIGCK